MVTTMESKQTTSKLSQSALPHKPVNNRSKFNFNLSSQQYRGYRCAEDQGGALQQPVESIVQVAMLACDTLDADQTEDLKISVFLSTLLFFKMTESECREQQGTKKPKKGKAGVASAGFLLFSPTLWQTLWVNLPLVSEPLQHVQLVPAHTWSVCGSC